MKLKYKIYLTIIALLTGFLFYAAFFMKSDYIESNPLPSTIAGEKVKVGDTNIITYKPDFLPKPIPEDVLEGSKENEFFYYLFYNPNKKVIFYQYKPGSKSPADSEEFHRQIDSYIRKNVIFGNYKNSYVTDSGASTYIKNMLKGNPAFEYTPENDKFFIHNKKLLAQKAKIEAVKDFYNECSKTMCIINPKTNEYVVIEKRDIKQAKKALEDYKKW